MPTRTSAPAALTTISICGQWNGGGGCMLTSSPCSSSSRRISSGRSLSASGGEPRTCMGEEKGIGGMSASMERQGPAWGGGRER